MKTETIREREKRENDKAIAKAQELGRNYTFIAEDGCEVTVTPKGNIFFNMADWF